MVNCPFVPPAFGGSEEEDGSSLSGVRTDVVSLLLVFLLEDDGEVVFFLDFCLLADDWDLGCCWS